MELTSQQVSTLVSGVYPTGIAIDVQGNVYFSDLTAVEKWNPATQQVSMVVSGLGSATGVAVDGQGNVYIADLVDAAVKMWNAATQQLTTLISAGLLGPIGVAVDPQGDVYVADLVSNGITVGYASLAATAKTESPAGGSDSVGIQVVPASLAVNATSDQSWLTIGAVSQAAAATRPSRGSAPEATPSITRSPPTPPAQRGRRISASWGSKSRSRNPGPNWRCTGRQRYRPAPSMSCILPPPLPRAGRRQLLLVGHGTAERLDHCFRHRDHQWHSREHRQCDQRYGHGNGRPQHAGHRQLHLASQLRQRLRFDHTGGANVTDVQYMFNEALGAGAAGDDLNHDGAVNVVDVLIVMNAVLGIA